MREKNFDNQQTVNPGTPLQEGSSSIEFISEFDPVKFIIVLKRSILYIALIIIVCIASSFLYLRYTKPVYQSSSSIKLDFKNTSSLLDINVDIFNNAATGGGTNTPVSQLAGEIELITSPVLLESVIDSLNLGISYYSVGDLLNNELYKSSPFKVDYYLTNKSYYGRNFNIVFISKDEFELSYYQANQLITSKHAVGEEIVLNEGFKFIVSRTPLFDDSEIGKVNFFTINNVNNLISIIRQNLGVEINNTLANTLLISYTDFNVNKAADIIAVITQNYMDYTIESKNKKYDQSLHYLDKQIQLTQDSLELFEKELYKYRTNNPIVFVESAEEAYKYIRDLQNLRKGVEYQINDYSTLIDLILADSNSQYIAVAAANVENTEILAITEKLVIANDVLKRVLGYYTEETYARRQKVEQINSIRRELIDLAIFSRTKLYEQLEDINKELAQARAKLKAPLDETPVDIEFRRLQRHYEIYEEGFNIMLGKLIEIGLAKAGTVSNFQILSHPSRNRTPLYPVPLKVYLIAAGAAIFTSIAVIAIRYFLQNTINSLKELDRLATPSIMGIVPKYDKHKMDYSQLVVNLNPKSSISESMRSIRTNLDFINTGEKRDTRIISVTSTISGEGKTFVTLNMGGVIAMSGLKVLIIDLDMRKPKIHTAFGVENFTGMSSLLIDRAELNECIHKTSIPTLEYITAGPLPPNPSELLMSDRFDKLIDRLSEQYDALILDTPPVGLVTDGLIAMKRATNTIYVVRADYSKTSFIGGLNRLVARQNLQNIGLVFNAVKPEHKTGYGDYGYGGYTGYGGEGYGYYE